jgi:DNA-binding CsgD family transcriptional regulator
MEGLEPFLVSEHLTVYVGAVYRVFWLSLCSLLEQYNFIIANNQTPADVALVDLSHLSPPYPPPAGVPTLALINGSYAESKAALMGGYRGYLTQDTDPQLLPKALRAVAKGEIWAERKIIAEFVSIKNVSKLTERELEIQSLLEQGRSNQEIAQQLNISISTVKAHVTSLLSKVNAKSRLELATRRSKNQP